MSKRNLEPIPAPMAGEPAECSAARISEIYSQHLDHCYECNYDKECQACYADGQHPPEAHSCNCTENGWGTKTRRVIRELASARVETAQARPDFVYRVEFSASEIYEAIAALGQAIEYRRAMGHGITSRLERLRERLSNTRGTPKASTT